MAITPATFQWYNHVSERSGDGGIDWDTSAFTMTLHTSAYVFAATQTTSSDLTNEVSGNGYAPIVLAGVTWTRSGSTTTFDFTDPVWTASGGSITARRFVIRDSTNDLLVCSGLLDSADADVVTTDGNTLTYEVNASGQFTATLTNP